MSEQTTDKDREIELTPVMIEAGASVVWETFDDVIVWGSQTGPELAKRVWVAMKNAQLQ